MKDKKSFKKLKFFFAPFTNYYVFLQNDQDVLLIKRSQEFFNTKKCGFYVDHMTELFTHFLLNICQLELEKQIWDVFVVVIDKRPIWWACFCTMNVDKIKEKIFS